MTHKKKRLHWVALILMAVIVVLVKLSAAQAAVRLAHVGDFSRPTYVTAPPGDTQRLFVVQQTGQVMLIKGGVPSTFLDLSSEVKYDGNEQGLLSIAFAPDFATSHRLYAYYTSTNCPQAPGCDEHVSEFTANGDTAGSERLLFTIPHPTYANHNGGQLQFGPDSALYISVGDGGGASDSEQNGQRPDGLLGKILRLAPGSTTPTVWAYGLRNPWRFSFDSGTMWIGDVGQDSFEEVDRGQAGANYGWPCFEGFHSNGAAPAAECPPKTPVVSPVLEYPHNSNCGGAGFCGEGVIGGYVMHDPTLPALNGCYVYGDLATPRLRVAGLTAQKALSDADLGPSVTGLSSFGTDAARHLYAASVSSGGVWRLESDGNHATDPTCATALPQPPPPPPPTPSPPPKPDPPPHPLCDQGHSPTRNPANPLDLPVSPGANPLHGAHFFVAGPRYGAAVGAIEKLLGLNPASYPDSYSWARFKNDLHHGALGRRLGRDPRLHRQIHELAKIADQPEAQRFSNFSAGGGPGKIFQQVQRMFCYKTLADPGGIPIVNTYFLHPSVGNCPSRAQLAAAAPAFRRRVDELVSATGANPAVFLLELDAYGSSSCMQHRGDLDQYEDLVRYEVDQVATLPHAVVYLEAGYSDSNSAAYTARALNRSDIGRIRGFYTNDTHFVWTINEVKWANAISRMTHGAHYVVNTAVNGNGPKLSRHPVTQGIEDLCDPPGVALGPRTNTSTGFPRADAWLWTHAPGYSNGCRKDAPPSGVYWTARAVALASRANERLGPRYPSRRY